MFAQKKVDRNLLIIDFEGDLSDKFSFDLISFLEDVEETIFDLCNKGHCPALLINFSKVSVIGHHAKEIILSKFLVVSKFLKKCAFVSSFEDIKDLQKKISFICPKSILKFFSKSLEAVLWARSR